MSDDATIPSDETMDCRAVARHDLLERYLAGGLSEVDREAVERHYFSCSQCFEALQVLAAMKSVLRRDAVVVGSGSGGKARWWLAAGALAAALVLLAVLPSLHPWAPDVPRVASRNSAPAQVGQAARPAPPTPAAAPARAPSIDQLARVEAPRYAPSRLRGVADEATSRFQRGMAHYARADYARAIPELEAAAQLAPDAPHITFYLGIAHLMTGQGDAAIDRLQATVALGESAYLADAHWYLAKAYLRRQDLRAAESHVRQCIRLGASNPEEARRLLEDVERVQRSPR